jgi:hypothetical protein
VVLGVLGRGRSQGGRASDSWYFENDITILSGEEFITFHNLADGYPTKRMVTTCCYSTLCGDHPGYQGNVCITCAARPSPPEPSHPPTGAVSCSPPLRGCEWARLLG